MRAIDMLMAFPYLLLALAIVAALGSRPAQRPVRDLHRQHPVLRPRGSRGHRRPEAARLCGRRTPERPERPVDPDRRNPAEPAAGHRHHLLHHPWLDDPGDGGPQLPRPRSAAAASRSRLHAGRRPKPPAGGAAYRLDPRSGDPAGRDRHQPCRRRHPRPRGPPAGIRRTGPPRSRDRRSPQRHPPANRRGRRPDAILSVRNLKTHFLLNEDRYKAVDDVSFDLRPGECLGIVGEFRLRQIGHRPLPARPRTHSPRLHRRRQHPVPGPRTLRPPLARASESSRQPHRLHLPGSRSAPSTR